MYSFTSWNGTVERGEPEGPPGEGRKGKTSSEASNVDRGESVETRWSKLSSPFVEREEELKRETVPPPPEIFLARFVVGP